MRRDALVVLGDRLACPRRCACGFSVKPGNHLAVPQHVVGDQETARTQQPDQRIEQRVVERLVSSPGRSV
jgi:hypothetical protein